LSNSGLTPAWKIYIMANMLVALFWCTDYEQAMSRPAQLRKLKRPNCQHNFTMDHKSLISFWCRDFTV